MGMARAPCVGAILAQFPLELPGLSVAGPTAVVSEPVGREVRRRLPELIGDLAAHVFCELGEKRLARAHQEILDFVAARAGLCIDDRGDDLVTAGLHHLRSDTRTWKVEHLHHSAER